MLIASVVFNALGVFIVKLRLNQLGALNLSSVKVVLSYVVTFIQAPAVVIGLVLFFVSPFLFAVALSRMEITVAFPVQLGLNFLLVLLLAVLFLGEHLTAVKLFGIAAIVLGIILLNRGA